MNVSAWTAPEWAAFDAVLSAIVTTLLIFVGAYQISALRDQNRRWRTLAACERYYLDPLLDKALRDLKSAKKDGRFEAEPKDFSIEVITILNYLNGIATGIYQGLYMDALARDHLHPMLDEHVAEYLNRDGLPQKVGVNPRDYRYLLALNAEWDQIGRPHFRQAGFFERVFRLVQRIFGRRRSL